MPVIPAIREAEVAVNQELAIALQPGGQCETPTQEKERKKIKLDTATTEQMDLWSQARNQSIFQTAKAGRECHFPGVV